MLYFSNSLGAAGGVLVSGFVLVPFVGLPGAGIAAGFVNFFRCRSRLDIGAFI